MQSRDLVLQSGNLLLIASGLSGLQLLLQLFELLLDLLGLLRLGSIPGLVLFVGFLAVLDLLALGGLGTDTGGSTRGPSSWNGLSGMKQTFGRVSKYGCVPLGYSLDHINPMARSAWRPGRS